MKYDYAIQKMPGYDYPAPYDRNEKQQRIWQVVEIERNEMGVSVKELQVRDNNMTHDELLPDATDLNKKKIMHKN